MNKDPGGNGLAAMPPFACTERQATATKLARRTARAVPRCRVGAVSTYACPFFEGMAGFRPAGSTYSGRRGYRTRAEGFTPLRRGSQLQCKLMQSRVES